MTDEVAFDGRVREAIGASIRDRGVIPMVADVAAALREPREAVDASFARMAAAHVFIPRRGTNEIYAYDPFCAEPTDFKVRTARRDWWAICGWDALGIPASLGAPGVLTTTCGDCGESLRIDVDGSSASSRDPVVLVVGVAARDFWKDIYFT